MPEYKWVRNQRGKEYAVLVSAFDPEIHEEVEGTSVVLDANGLPALEQNAPETPAKSAPKADWVQHAISQGMDPDEAEAATKADLIATHGKEN